MIRTYRIAAIPGDGIGKEVMPEGVRVLDAAARKFGSTRPDAGVGTADSPLAQRHQHADTTAPSVHGSRSSV